MKKLRVMIVSAPGTWQRVIQKSLETFQFVKMIDVVSGSLSASQRAKRHSPNLIVIDSSIPFEDVITLVQNMKWANPETRSAVIIDTKQQRREVMKAGADYTISSYDFEAQIGEILNQFKDTGPDEMAGSETNIKAAPGLSDQGNS